MHTHSRLVYYLVLRKTEDRTIDKSVSWNSVALMIIIVLNYRHFHFSEAAHFLSSGMPPLDPLFYISKQ